MKGIDTPIKRLRTIPPLTKGDTTIVYYRTKDSTLYLYFMIKTKIRETKTNASEKPLLAYLPRDIPYIVTKKYRNHN